MFDAFELELIGDLWGGLLATSWSLLRLLGNLLEACWKLLRDIWRPVVHFLGPLGVVLRRSSLELLGLSRAFFGGVKLEVSYRFFTGLIQVCIGFYRFHICFYRLYIYIVVF